MNQLARVITRHVILATFKLEFEPKDCGYNLIIKGHDISIDDGVALDACTNVKVAGPQILLSGDPHGGAMAPRPVCADA